MKNDITLSDILHAILSNIVLILAIALVFGLVAFGYTKAFISPTYQTSIRLYAVSNLNQNASEISVSEQNAAAQLASTYALILKSDTVMGEVSKQLSEMGYHYSSSQLKGMISTANTGTQVFDVLVTSTGQDSIKIIADTIANVAAEKIAKIVGSGELKIIDYAQVPRTPSSPNISSNTAMGVIIGLLIACLIVITRALTDSTIWTEEDIAKHIEVPILGTVPQLSNAEKEANAKE